MTDGLEIKTQTTDLTACIRDRVAVITLNRPQAKNAVTYPMRTALIELIARFAEDSQVGALLITAAGSAFCAGADVRAMDGRPAAASIEFDQEVADLIAEQRALTGALVALRKPTVAALPGAAAGMGLSIALACDIRVAARSAILVTAFARIALSGDYGVTWLLTRLVGLSRARELMLLSERIDAPRAEALGLVNRVMPDEDLQEGAFALARTLAAGPPMAHRLIKDNLDLALHAGFAEALDHEAVNLIRTMRTNDYREGVRAFLEKRKPLFEGR
jgi:enoyl-CoA hydratase/carnithine racemase